jgi:hypothetical protein
MLSRVALNIAVSSAIGSVSVVSVVPVVSVVFVVLVVVLVFCHGPAVSDDIPLMFTPSCED